MRRISEAYDDTLQHGGGTYTMMDLDDISGDFWAVGLTGFEFRVDEPSARDQFRIAYLALLKNASVQAAQGLPYQAALGTWIDEGTVYVDLVALVPDYTEAVALGTEREQVAIYNLKTEQTVRLQD